MKTDYAEYLKGLHEERDSCGIGLVANIDGKRDAQVLSDALKIVERLEHRAGKDASGKVGDGVGILMQLNTEFFKAVLAHEKNGLKSNQHVEKGGSVNKGNETSYSGGAKSWNGSSAEHSFSDITEGDLAVGMFFLPKDVLQQTFIKRMFEVICHKSSIELLCWRKVPIHPEILGKAAYDSMPCIEQAILVRPKSVGKGFEFDRLLFCVRREFEQGARDSYICSLSSRTVVYKGMFLVKQLREFYEDLKSDSYCTAIALVHSRFSTNTTPSWERAHPYRMIAHNGEINTIRGNIDRMLAREETLSSPLLSTDADRIFPVIPKAASDSAMLDNTLEFLYMNGMPLPLAMMAIIPEPWKHDKFMKQDRKDFYHYYATMMEPWDGPAAILFTDGEVVGATLDRNGLRPARYYVTDSGRLVLSSEVGVLDIPEEHIIEKSRLSPGRILLVDTREKRIISDEECKSYYANRQPYGEWLDRNLKSLKDLSIPNKRIPLHTQEERDRMYKVFGYSYEDVKKQILPMAENGIEETASMGTDVPLAVLSKRHPPLSHYFKQLFAQVTNPPIDSLREKIVTDTAVYIGSDGNLLNEDSSNVLMLEVENPILTAVDLMKIRALNEPGLRPKDVSLLYYKHTSLEKALEKLCIAVDRSCGDGANIIILSDRGVDENHVPIPSLLAVSCVEQHLVTTKKRTKVSIILESGDIRDVHEAATLLGYGARAIQPYLAHECIWELIDLGILDKDYHTAVDDYDRAILNGIVKIAAKMGISTLQSYQSAKIFEAVGLSKEFVDKYFTGTVSRVGGLGIAEIDADVTERHDRAFDPLGLPTDTTLDSVGFHNLRSNALAESHLYSPETIVLLQEAVRDNDYGKFKEYTALVDDPKRRHTLRSFLELVPKGAPVPLDEVEPVSEIVKRFKTGAMSYGSISKEAHEALAVAMNTLGGKSNTGEGGEDISRFGTNKNSAIKQVASARFGVTIEYLGSAQEIQIKMAQGAKPGEGGHLPGRKVYPWIAHTRHSTPGVALISPPPHHDIYSIEDLAQLIYDLKNANRRARIAVKLVSESGVGTIASGVAKAGAQVILISGYDGGTGAAPSSSIHHAGLPWELGLTEAHRTLVENGLRERVVLETDGKLMSGRDVAIAALLGAEEFGFATTALVSLGCMMMRVCNKDSCPFGVATQNETLRKHFKGKSEYVVNFMRFIAEELREIMAGLGFRSLSEMTGRSDCLKQRESVDDSRTAGLDLSVLLNSSTLDADRAMDASEHTGRFDPEKAYDFHLQDSLDESVLLPAFKAVLERAASGKPAQNALKPKAVEVKVSSTNRSFGTIFGSVVSEKCGRVCDDSFIINARGGGGQSFGAFLPKGVTIRLKGDANDGFGKGLSGGKLVLSPPEETAGGNFEAEKNIIVGNVALYGATSGSCYIDGVAGERFLIRNSGAVAVSLGCGDHGLEYMTGGRAVILGSTGKNFAAGMSGGIAYIYDKKHDLYLKLNKDMVELNEVREKHDIQELKGIIEDFVHETGSKYGRLILENFLNELQFFKKVIPSDYKKMLIAVGQQEETGLSREKAELEAFKLLYA